MTSRDEAALFTVKDVTDRELRLAAITVCWEFQEFKAIPQEEGIAPFLCPKIFPIDCGRLHCQPGPVLCCSSQLICL